MKNTTTPFWETAAMIGSFVLLWLWFFAYQESRQTHQPLPLYIHLILLGSLAVMVIITVRRAGRLKRALRGEDQEGNPSPIYPMFGKPPEQGKK